MTRAGGPSPTLPGAGRVYTSAVTEDREDRDAYSRDEPEAQRLDRNWGELLQELRVVETGVQILFAFLLSIGFQARFSRTSAFQRDVYVVTLMLSGLSTAIFIAPVAIHRFLFRFRAKDEIVEITNKLALGGLAVLALAMVGAILLVSDWVAGTTGAVVCTILAGLMFVAGWLAFPMQLRARAEQADPADLPTN